MRDIKFRAWDSNAGCFVYFGIGQSCVKHYHDNERWTFEIDGNTKAYQFTGLKDVNGVEIYEGDIVKTANQILEVKARPKTDVSRGHGDCAFSASISYFEAYGNGEDAVIVGNIYENPELLKRKG